MGGITRQSPRAPPTHRTHPEIIHRTGGSAGTEIVLHLTTTPPQDLPRSVLKMREPPSLAAALLFYFLLWPRWMWVVVLVSCFLLSKHIYLGRLGTSLVRMDFGLSWWPKAGYVILFPATSDTRHLCECICSMCRGGVWWSWREGVVSAIASGVEVRGGDHFCFGSSTLPSAGPDGGLV